MSSPVPASVRMTPERTDSSTRLVLVRHGEAACHLRGVVGGPGGCTGLSELGVQQAQSLRRRLEETGELSGASALYASVLTRAVQTASVIGPAVGSGMLGIVEDSQLCELHPGDADGLSWEEFRLTYGEPDWDVDPDTPVAPGGESWTGFVARAAEALSSLARRHRGEEAVVVCHAGVIEAAMLRFLPVDGSRRRLGLRTSYVSLTEFELTGPDVEGTQSGDWRLLRYNDAAHLPG
ncbi:MAG TPA: histidine phosphatase family protein [Acidimicrobiaceae bacterium]|nr:histidine phosphatase family protein [Acidimicrobiaceae bacterium]